MSTVHVFEPGLCCGTGICGVDVDQRLVDFSAALTSVRTAGGDIDRFNLAQDPLAFAQDDTARAFLNTVGSKGLPITIVDGATVLTGRYPSQIELENWSATPTTASGPAGGIESASGSCGNDACC